MSKANEIVPINQGLAALRDWNNLGEIVQANMGGQTVDFGALESIRVPSGGAPVFVTENEIDGIETAKEFEGLLCWFNDVRAWWSQPFDEGGGGTQPSCMSNDLLEGVGDNTICNPDDAVEDTHECKKCPNNRFGPNAVDNGGNWCKETREMFVLRQDKPDVVFPSVLRAPPTSLRPIKRYMMGLAARGIPYFGAMHRFSLESATNPAGIAYSTIRMSLVRKLEKEEIESLQGYAEMMRETFSTQQT